MKKTVTGILCLLLVFALSLVTSAADVAKMTIKSNKSELSRGDTFTLTVSLKNDQPVTAGSVALSYDTAVFQLLGGECKVKNASGQVSAEINGGAFTLESEAVVTGTLFTIRMQVKEDAPFGEYTISGNPGLDVSCSLSGTTVTVVCLHDYNTGTQIDEDEHEAICAICNDRKTEEHIWDSGTVTRKPTCQTVGKKDVTCTVCGAEGVKNVSMLPHTNTYEDLQTQGHRFTCQKCGETGIETHSYPDTWEHEENEHYRACAECGYQRDRAAHVPGPAATETENQICTVCSRVLQVSMDHDHTFTEQWHSDDTAHWHKCAACDATRDMEEHLYDSECDTDCSVCGVTRQPPHSLGDWDGDSASHWRVCGGCGQRFDVGQHTPSQENLSDCTVCGRQLLTDHKHDFQSAHTHVCACGETQSGTAQFCKVCGTFPWWILCVAEGVLFAGILLFMRQKHKQEDEYLD